MTPKHSKSEKHHKHKNEHKVEESVLPIIKKKYQVILILLVVIGIMMPEYVGSDFLAPLYLVVFLIGIITYGLYDGWNFRKVNKRLRPFVATCQGSYLAIGFGVAVLIETVPVVLHDSTLVVPYAVFWLLCIALIWQFSSIFKCAHDFKKKDPMRCEFC